MKLIRRWELIRYSFYDWLAFEVLKEDPVCVPGRIMRIVHFILFPFMTMYSRQSILKYDYSRDIFTFYGMKFSGSFLRNMNKISQGKDLYLITNKDDCIQFESVKTDSFDYLKSSGIYVTISFVRNLNRRPAWRYIIEDVEECLYKSNVFYDRNHCRSAAIDSALSFINASN